MPPYATAVQEPILAPPITPPYPLFNKEVLTAPTTSIPIQWNGQVTGGYSNLKTFTATFSTPPTAAVIDILGSDENSSVNDFGVVGTISFGGSGQVMGFYTDEAPSKHYCGRLTSVTWPGAAGTLLLTISA
jgi:hypothetical protein